MDSIDEWKDDALDNIQEVDELDVKDIRVRPDIYIHFGILKAQNCLNKENVRDGMLTYILMVDHIVTIARSSKILRKSFDEDLVKWKESDPDYKIEKDEFIKKVKLSNKKMEICLEDVFEGRMQSGFLKFRHPK